MLYLENHDHPRIVSRYGSERFWKESAKTLAASYLFLQGTPFIYQGQEIGMLNWRPSDPELYEDVQTRWQYAHSALKKSPEQRLHRLWRSSRDSARTPMQWTDDENAGFTSGTPWFCVNENYSEINVRQQEEDSDSILNFYRRAIALRKRLQVVRDGEYREYFRSSAKLYCYSRETPAQRLLVLCSFSERCQRLRVPSGFELKRGELALQNYADPQPDTLKPYECRVYLWESHH